MNEFILQDNEYSSVQGFSAEELTETLEHEYLDNSLFIAALGDQVELLAV